MPLFQFVSPKEVKEGKHIVKTPLIIETEVSISDINQAIASYVKVSSDKSSLGIISPKLYIHSKTENKIIYACGNKVNPKMFVAELSLSENQGKITGVFKILSHYVQKDVVVQMDLMKQLRNEVKSAFASFDSTVIVNE